MTTDLSSPLPRMAACRFETSVAHDADEQARNLHGWTQTYDQLTAGRFVGRLTGLHLDDMHVFCETTSQTLRQTCEVPSDAYWFGIPADDQRVGRIGPQPIGGDSLAFQRGGVEFELLTPGGYAIFGVVVRGEVLHRHAEFVEHADRIGRAAIGRAAIGQAAHTGIIPIDTQNKSRFCALLAGMLDDAANAALSERARRNLQASVLSSLFELCTTASLEPVAIPARPRRQWIVSEARDYVLANRDRPIGVPELCERLHVSRRTLQYCFQDVLGLAPASYLRAIRLNGARRDLCDAAPGERTVQDVAAAWGFWHLSQFATDYRKLFGVRPSETLKTIHATASAPLAH
ncbi:helix-turn-helix domain-containing protein [Paraburkholderia caribensis]|uniref:AraC family transcriptional regulator n=1 Tax=Paraburkholderia caribensis TaxID=75105 RepID=A0A9Q6RZS5_9BURK|nr:helix-turn-helix domain-containing protein [Paraburkholderia caribensis]MCO4875899.1 helix-turn-helix domain-containing protein [Paraburkholderia caribensis]MDR6383051.1 AraC family ethanolamine operon transcriptional activator [Paraburkholderia caribensis]PTB29595.1 AraC family transcriptional regulator [Paraburkholderia caribensis]QLB62482.1 AraC family transcriptional regulator [Paraburkholderia caribensis]